MSGAAASYMRGVMFTNPNQPLTIEDFLMPHAKANEILVKTKGIFLYPFFFVSSTSALIKKVHAFMLLM